MNAVFKPTKQAGFTIVELLIVIVVIGILAAITIVSFNGVQSKARTAASLSTVNQVRDKSAIWSSLVGSYPNLAQLRTNSISPPDIDTAGGDFGPVEAKLSSPDVAIGAEMTQVRADGGNTVLYEPCWDGTQHSGAKITYWDFSASDDVETKVGNCP